MGGNLILVLAFLGLVVFSIYKSKKRLNTVLYTALAMALTVGFAWGIGQIAPALNTAAVGVTTFDVMLVVGMLTALYHCSMSET